MSFGFNTAPPAGGAAPGAAPAAPAAPGGFGFGQGGAASAPAASSAAPAAGGFGGFGATAPKAADGKAPAAAGGFGGFGATAPKAADGKAPAAAGGFGGFGATAPTAADGKAPAAAGGFGGFGATAPTTADGKAPAAAGGFGGFGSAAAKPPVQLSPPADFTGQPLSSVLSKLDSIFFDAHKEYKVIADFAAVRDQNMIRLSDHVADVQMTVNKAWTTAKKTAETLALCKEKQENISKMLQSLEESVQPIYQVAQETFDPDDRARAAALGDVVALFDEVYNVEQRMRSAVRQHNKARREMSEVNEVDRVVGVLDHQFRVLDSCAQSLQKIDKELDVLIGK